MHGEVGDRVGSVRRAAGIVRNIEESVRVGPAVRSSRHGAARRERPHRVRPMRRRRFEQGTARRSTIGAPAAPTRTTAASDKAAARARRPAHDWGRHRRKSRQALRILPPRRPRVMKPVRASRPGRYPGWRRTGSPSRAKSRSGPRRMRNACRTRPSRPASNDAAAYRCGGSAGWRLAGESARPASRLTARATRVHRGGASLGAGRASVKKASRDVRNVPRNTPIRDKKRGCYDWKRYRCRNARYSALKCWVFRGRSRCSTNSKPFLKILAD